MAVDESISLATQYSLVRTALHALHKLQIFRESVPANAVDVDARKFTLNPEELILMCTTLQRHLHDLAERWKASNERRITAPPEPAVPHTPPAGGPASLRPSTPASASLPKTTPPAPPGVAIPEGVSDAELAAQGDAVAQMLRETVMRRQAQAMSDTPQPQAGPKHFHCRSVSAEDLSPEDVVQVMDYLLAILMFSIRCDMQRRPSAYSTQLQNGVSYTDVAADYLAQAYRRRTTLERHLRQMNASAV